METVLTTTQAAERLGVTPRRVAALITAGRLPANQFGGSWMIQEADLALVADRKVGRPAKAKDESASATSAAKAITTVATDTAEADVTEAKPKRTRKAKAAKPKRAGKKAKAA